MLQSMFLAKWLQPNQNLQPQVSLLNQQPTCWKWRSIFAATWVSMILLFCLMINSMEHCTPQLWNRMKDVLYHGIKVKTNHFDICLSFSITEGTSFARRAQKFFCCESFSWCIKQSSRSSSSEAKTYKTNGKIVPTWSKQSSCAMLPSSME